MKLRPHEFVAGTTGPAGSVTASHDFDDYYGVPVCAASLSPSKSTGLLIAFNGDSTRSITANSYGTCPRRLRCPR
jgi:hypothetical protein